MSYTHSNSAVDLGFDRVSMSTSDQIDRLMNVTGAHSPKQVIQAALDVYDEKVSAQDAGTRDHSQHSENKQARIAVVRDDPAKAVEFFERILATCDKLDTVPLANEVTMMGDELREYLIGDPEGKILD